MLWDPNGDRTQFAYVYPNHYLPVRMPPYHQGEFGEGLIAKHKCPSELISPPNLEETKWHEWNEANKPDDATLRKHFVHKSVIQAVCSG